MPASSLAGVSLPPPWADAARAGGLSLQLLTRSHAVSGPRQTPSRQRRDPAADLILVGSKGMQGARRVLGSVPNSVTHGADCSVLV
jgi:nucleotide-binding universal stress UspA family protein